MNHNKLGALCEKILSGSYFEVQSLLIEGVDPNGKYHDGKTPLMIAAYSSCREIVEQLINFGADVHSSDNRGWTVLHHSVQGTVEIVQCIVNKGVALNAKNDESETPLILAAQCAHSEVAELLINLGADIDCCDVNGWTALHHASVRASEEIIQSLVNKGVALNAKNNHNQTPLMLAVYWSCKEVIELLINSGADINCCDEIPGWSALHHAAYQDSADIAQCLVDGGIFLDKKDPKGETPLMIAASQSNCVIAELLINSGAAINCCNNFGLTVLHCAISESCLPIVKLLIKKGADINAQNSNGETPLHLTLKMDEMTISYWLLKAGADCNSEDCKGESPFSYLIQKKKYYVRIIKLCIEKGAYVKTTDYINMLEDPLQKMVILQDVKLCSQAVLNKFNNGDLPLLYKRVASTHKLPHIDKMKIRNGSGRALEVEQAVAHAIKVKGFCNLLEIALPVLSMLCVKSSIDAQ